LGKSNNNVGAERSIYLLRVETGPFFIRKSKITDPLKSLLMYPTLNSVLADLVQVPTVLTNSFTVDLLPVLPTASTWGEVCIGIDTPLTGCTDAGQGVDVNTEQFGTDFRQENETGEQTAQQKRSDYNS